jgi:hypothetical protein
MICIFGVFLSAYIATRVVSFTYDIQKEIQGPMTSYSPKLLLFYLYFYACLSATGANLSHYDSYLTWPSAITRTSIICLPKATGTFDEH